MQITLEDTSKVVEFNGVPCRIWEGVTAKGVRVHAYIVRVGVHEDEDYAEFERVARQAHMRNFRTDRNNNPTAFTTDIAGQAELREGVDYEVGDAFAVGNQQYHTARLLGDPVALTIQVIDKMSFYTRFGSQRWNYIGIPPLIWFGLDAEQKKAVIAFMYQHEGGTAMKGLFA